MAQQNKLYVAAAYNFRRKFMTKAYELMVIAKPNLGADKFKVVEETLTSLIEKNEGKVLLLKSWGIRELATVFKKFGQGYYIQCQFEGSNKTLEELNTKMRINEDIIRSLILCMDEINPDITSLNDANPEREKKFREPKVTPSQEEVLTAEA